MNYTGSHKSWIPEVKVALEMNEKMADGILLFVSLILIRATPWGLLGFGSKRPEIKTKYVCHTTKCL